MSKTTRSLLVSVLGTVAFVGATVLTAPALAETVEGKLAVEDGGRTVSVGDKKFKVSGSRTKITVAGKEAGRNALKAGMNCKVEGEGEAKSITCK